MADFSAPEWNWHDPCNVWGKPANNLPAGSGRQTMTFNIANLQQLAVSVLGALVASSIFISAATGPVTPFF